MFRRIHRFWEEHGFITLVIITIIFFLLYWLFVTRHHDKGSYSTSYYYEGGGGEQQPKKKKNGVQQTSRGELICKQFLERLFQRPFIKCRPPFLYNTVTSENLELDLYNSDLNLAVEYNGKQHYEYVPYLHNYSRDRFQNQKYRDEKKIELCRQNGVPLIIVPYTVPFDKIPIFLSNEIRKLGIPIPK